MLELPESFAIAKQLNETIKGKKINLVTANASPHKFAWFSGNPAEYHTLLRGKTICESVPFAGQIEIAAEDCRLFFCDGANLRFYSSGAKLPEKHQLLLEFDDGSALAVCVQMYGGLWAYLDGENDNSYYRTAKQKPSPLTDAFDAVYFRSLFDEKSEKLSAKAFLATEQRIPGLGNGVLQDILFHAKIHPKRKINTLTKDGIENLYDSVKSTICKMADEGGRNTERDLFGNHGGYLTKMSKNTLSIPCPDCGGQIKKEAYLGGAVYYCPMCQK